MEGFFWVALFALGVAIGSFLNVFTLRYKPEGRFFSLKRTVGRSACMHCHTQLRWFELIPVVSFIIQRGKCNTCRARLSLQYPIIEIVSGLLFVFVPLVIRNSFDIWSVTIITPWFLGVSLFWIVVMLSLLLVVIIDLRHYIIPNSLNFFLGLLGIVWIVLGYGAHIFDNVGKGSFLGSYSLMFGQVSSPLLSHLIGAGVGFLFFFLLVLISKGRGMGVGDVKLMLSLGLLFGWPDIALIGALSFIIGALVSVLLITANKKKMKDKIPFGPFIAISATLVFVWGAGLLHTYFAILGA